MSFIAFQKAIQDLNLPTIDFYKIAKKEQWPVEELFYDGVHLSAKGHQIYSETFFILCINFAKLKHEFFSAALILKRNSGTLSTLTCSSVMLLEALFLCTQ